MAVSGALKLAVTTAIAAAVAAVVALPSSSGPQAAGGHVRVGVAGAGLTAVYQTVIVDTSAQAQLGIDGGGVSVYALTKICVLTAGGTDPGMYAVPGITIVATLDATGSCTAVTDALFEVWTAARSDALNACMCASDATCLVGGQAAVRSRTYQPGVATGTGCVQKPCVQMSGFDSMPVACR